MEIGERQLHTIDFSLVYDANEDEFNEVDVFKSIISKCKDKSSKIGFKRMFDPEEIQMINGLDEILNNEKSRTEEAD